MKRRKVSLKLPIGKQRDPQDSNTKELYKIIHRHLSNTVSFSSPPQFQNIWKREKIVSSHYLIYRDQDSLLDLINGDTIKSASQLKF